MTSKENTLHIPSHLVCGPICPVTLGIGIMGILSLLIARVKSKVLRDQLITVLAFLVIFLIAFVSMELFEIYGWSISCYAYTCQWLVSFFVGGFIAVLLFRRINTYRCHTMKRNSKDRIDDDHSKG